MGSGCPWYSAVISKVTQCVDLGPPNGSQEWWKLAKAVVRLLARVSSSFRAMALSVSLSYLNQLRTRADLP